jgi:hypothetical protein
MPCMRHCPSWYCASGTPCPCTRANTQGSAQRPANQHESVQSPAVATLCTLTSKAPDTTPQQQPRTYNVHTRPSIHKHQYQLQQQQPSNTTHAAAKRAQRSHDCQPHGASTDNQSAPMRVAAAAAAAAAAATTAAAAAATAVKAAAAAERVQRVNDCCKQQEAASTDKQDVAHPPAQQRQ